MLFGALGVGAPPPRSTNPPFGPSGLDQTTLAWWFDWSFGVPIEKPRWLWWMSEFQRQLFDAGLTIGQSNWLPPVALGGVLVLVGLIVTSLAATVMVLRRPNVFEHLANRDVRRTFAEGITQTTLYAIVAAHLIVFWRAIVILRWNTQQHDQLASVPLALWAIGTVVVVAVIAGAVNGRAWYECALAGPAGCPDCGYPRSGGGVCSECGRPHRSPKRVVRLFRRAGVAAAAVALLGAIVLLVADPLRLARIAFEKQFDHKALVLLVPGEVVEAKIDGRWWTLTSHALAPGTIPDLLLRPFDQPSTEFARLQTNGESIMVGTRKVFWTIDRGTRSEWKGLALVLVIEKEGLEDVRRGVTPHPSQP